MKSDAESHTETSADTRTPFEKFRDLTRRILTTPKADLIGQPAPKKHSAKGKKK